MFAKWQIIDLDSNLPPVIARVRRTIQAGTIRIVSLYIGTHKRDKMDPMGMPMRKKTIGQFNERGLVVSEALVVE
jgi:hypothetical protein